MKKWEIKDVETMTPEQQQEYLEKLKEHYQNKKGKAKKVWEVLFAAGALAIFGGAMLIGVGGEAFNTPGAATIISAAIAEMGIAFGSMANVSDIEMEAQRQIEETERKISKTR